jgi:hypothetical protein
MGPPSRGGTFFPTGRGGGGVASTTPLENGMAAGLQRRPWLRDLHGKVHHANVCGGQNATACAGQAGAFNR